MDKYYCTSDGYIFYNKNDCMYSAFETNSILTDYKPLSDYYSVIINDVMNIRSKHKYGDVYPRLITTARMYKIHSRIPVHELGELHVIYSSIISKSLIIITDERLTAYKENSAEELISLNIINYISFRDIIDKLNKIFNDIKNNSGKP